jgi:hypothetical protein
METPCLPEGDKHSVQKHAYFPEGDKFHFQKCLVFPKGTSSLRGSLDLGFGFLIAEWGETGAPLAHAGTRRSSLIAANERTEFQDAKDHCAFSANENCSRKRGQFSEAIFGHLARLTEPTALAAGEY